MMAHKAPVLMEVVQSGPIAEAILERLGSAFQLSDPQQLGQFEVVIPSSDSDDARGRIAAVAAGVDLNWENFVHFIAG